ncbi:MAG: hypothetical protein HP498_01450 [Nitrospira sp.]|nr:hypothetical protein [Nitrospira sp.]
MIAQGHVRYVALALLFTFCQVIGTMCAVPDLLERHETASLIEDRMACPMDEAIMCPPSLTSSPERHIKQSVALGVDHAAILSGHAVISTVSPAGMRWFRSSVHSIVPISIESSSVLRI